MKKIGIGVIGCGGMGRGVANRVLKQDPGLSVVSLYDPDPRSVEEAVKQFNPGVKVCSLRL